MVQIIDKGEFPDSGHFVSLQRYVLFSRGEKRRLGLQFYNGGDFVVTGLRFTVFRPDGNGVHLEELSFTLNGLNAQPRSQFSVPELAVPSTWGKVGVRVEEAYSESFAYTLEGDRLQVAYRGEDALTGLRGEKLYLVKRRRKKLAGTCVLLAFCLFALTLGIGFAAGVIKIKSGEKAQTEFTQTVGEELC